MYLRYAHIPYIFSTRTHAFLLAHISPCFRSTTLPCYSSYSQCSLSCPFRFDAFNCCSQQSTIFCMHCSRPWPLQVTACHWWLCQRLNARLVYQKSDVFRDIILRVCWCADILDESFRRLCLSYEL